MYQVGLNLAKLKKRVPSVVRKVYSGLSQIHWKSSKSKTDNIIRENGGGFQNRSYAVKPLRDV